jgi:hypothetical protein
MVVERLSMFLLAYSLILVEWTRIQLSVGFDCSALRDHPYRCGYVVPGALDSARARHWGAEPQVRASFHESLQLHL